MVTNNENLKDVLVKNEPKLVLLYEKSNIEKLVLCIEIIEHITNKRNTPMLFFSLENGKDVIKNKIIDYKSNLHIDYTICIPINKIIDKVTTLFQNKNTGFVLIDSLRFIVGSKLDYSNREEECIEIIQKLENLSNDLSIPIILMN